MKTTKTKIHSINNHIRSFIDHTTWWVYDGMWTEWYRVDELHTSSYYFMSTWQYADFFFHIKKFFAIFAFRENLKFSIDKPVIIVEDIQSIIKLRSSILTYFYT